MINTPEEKEITVILPNSKKVTESYQKVKADIPKYWSKEYINQQINYIKNYKDRMLISFLWMTGLRITEALSIKKKDLDFTNHTVTVKWIKNKKYKYRVAPLHPRIKDLIQLYTASLNLEDAVFPYSRQYAWKLTKKYLNGSPHQLRHSFAVNWLRSQGDIVTLHRILGHSKIQTTMEYLKIVPIDQAKELNKISFD